VTFQRKGVMNKRVKDMWLKALRSGEFKQCRGFLAKNDKYCALGVLSILAVLEGICTFNDLKGVGTFDNRRFTLSYNVMKWAEIAQDDERFLDPDEHEVILNIKGKSTSVLELNDKGMSFKKLATIIERHL
jgi:hypothetical protein